MDDEDTVESSYVATIQEKLEYIDSYMQLIREGQVPPQILNHAMATYASTLGDITQWQELAEFKLDNLKKQYNKLYHTWFDTTSREMRIGIPKSRMVSVGEIEAKIHIDHSQEYDDWQTKLMVAEHEAHYYARMVKNWERHGDMLANLGHNMRAELKALDVESGIKRKLRRG